MQAVRAEKPNDTYFAALTGVRAIAAYMVYFHHSNVFWGQSSWRQGIYHFISELHIGVTLFFVLSGFLIGFRYLELQNFTFRNYMINRIARIYPMYFLLTTITFIFFAVQQQDYTLHHFNIYVGNITFIKGFSESMKFTGISQGWSLTVEETFYLLAPLFFLLIKRNKISLFILPILLISLGMILVFLLSDRVFFTNFTFFENFNFMFNYTFFGRCTEFFIGIGLAMLFKQKSQPTNYKYLTYIGLFVIISSVYVLSLLKGDADYGINQPIGKIINNLLLPLFGIATFYYGLLTEKTFIAKVLSNQVFILLGKSSYIFYLIHMGVLAVGLKSILEYLFISLPAESYLSIGSKLLLNFILLNIIAIILFTYIEEPLNHFIRNKFRKNSPSNS